MPEGPEVKYMGDQLRSQLQTGGTVCTLTNVNVLTGRYKKEPLVGLEQVKELFPLKITSVNVKGKFMWISFENSSQADKSPSDVFLMITFGMSGGFKSKKEKHGHIEFTFKTKTEIPTEKSDDEPVDEKSDNEPESVDENPDEKSDDESVDEKSDNDSDNESVDEKSVDDESVDEKPDEKPDEKRKTSRSTFKLWFTDMRGFGTLKFVFSADEINAKLNGIGPDMLSDEISKESFIQIIRRKNNWTLPKILMDQSLMSGIGNYLKSEVLYKTRISPLTTASELSDSILTQLYYNTKSVIKESYEKTGTAQKYTDIRYDNNNKEFQFEVYSKYVDRYGHKIIKTTTDDKRVTYWVPELQNKTNVTLIIK